MRAGSLVLCQELDGSGLLDVSKTGDSVKQWFSVFEDQGFRRERKAQTGQEMRGGLGLSRGRRIQDWGKVQLLCDTYT